MALDETKKNGSGWLVENVKVILFVSGLVVTVAGQWYSFLDMERRSHLMEERLRLHEQDISRHIDPVRDQERVNEILRRLDAIERRVDVLVRR